MPPSTREAPLLSLCFCVGIGAVVRLGLLSGHDLRGAFGPDAPGAAAAAQSGILTHPYPLHPLLIRIFSLWSGDSVQGALSLSITAGLATVAAAWLLGRVITEGRDGRSTAMLAATAPLWVHGSLLRGGDALALALAAWGLALGWWGGTTMSSPHPGRGPRIALVSAGLLWGLSAAAKPIALPLGALLLLTPMLGGRRCLPWLGAGLFGGMLLALPFLGPFLRPSPAMGLLGSWWTTGVPSPAGLLGWLGAGLRVAWRMVLDASWAELGPLLGLALVGCVVAAPRRRFRWAVLLVGTVAVVGLAAMLGDRLQPRYLAAASTGWLLLAGVALTPGELRRGGVTGGWGRVVLGPLPLSMVVTAFFIADLRVWDALGTLRAQEEGATAPQGFFGGWGDPSPLREAYADSSVCGALELERLALDLSRTAPRGGTVVTLPLRDGRAWHLLGPLAARRPDLTLLELGEACCPAGPERCAALLPDALATAGGGSLVVPLAPEGRCETGALPAGLEPWAEALRPVTDEQGVWYGSLAVSPVRGAAAVRLCTALGGREPVAPARP